MEMKKCKDCGEMLPRCEFRHRELRQFLKIKQEWTVYYLPLSYCTPCEYARNNEYGKRKRREKKESLTNKFP